MSAASLAASGPPDSEGWWFGKTAKSAEIGCYCVVRLIYASCRDDRLEVFVAGHRHSLTAIEQWFGRVPMPIEPPTKEVANTDVITPRLYAEIMDMAARDTLNGGKANLQFNVVSDAVEYRIYRHYPSVTL